MFEEVNSWGFQWITQQNTLSGRRQCWWLTNNENIDPVFLVLGVDRRVLIHHYATNIDRTNSLLRRNIWWRTCTTIGIVWFAGDYSYLPNLNEETKEESSALRKLINRHESNFTFMVLSATSQALMTDPLPISNVNTVLSSRVVSNTSPVSARVPS